MSTPTGGQGRPELRISDTERDAAVTALGEHYAAGRLTKDEYDERAATAYAARTASALRPLFGDLPAPHPFATPPREAAGARTRGAGPGAWGGPGPGWSPRQTLSGPGRPPSDRGFRVPFLPLVLVLVGLAVLWSAPWLVFLGLGVFFFTRSKRRHNTWSGCGSRTRHG